MPNPNTDSASGSPIQPEGAPISGPSGCSLTAASEMSPELQAALERVRNHVMTPEEVFEQRVSFVYGQLMSNNDDTVTKDDVRKRLIQQMGRPPCDKCADLTAQLAHANALAAFAQHAPGCQPSSPIEYACTCGLDKLRREGRK